MVGWKFRVRNVIEPNLLKDHHGIGVRIDELKDSKQWSGVISKTYEAVYAKGDKPVEEKPKPAPAPVSPRKEQPVSPRKKEEEEGVKKSKSWKEKLGIKKDKKDGGSAGGGKEEKGGKDADDDDDYFH